MTTFGLTSDVFVTIPSNDTMWFSWFELSVRGLQENSPKLPM